MKLESLNSSRVEILGKETMRFVVGGQAHVTGASTGSDCTKYSNDAVDQKGENHVSLGGGDFGRAMLQRYAGELG